MKNVRETVVRDASQINVRQASGNSVGDELLRLLVDLICEAFRRRT
jgi:hypothetical protein